MRYGIFGDIHANLEALSAVLRAYSEEKIDRYFCVGDIVGYGADPSQCLQKIRELNCLTVAGNHDYAVAEKLPTDYFNAYAREAVNWTKRQLSAEELEFLSNLQLVAEVDSITLVHGTLKYPEMFDYIQTTYDAYLSLQLLRNKVCFVGHSHVPIAFLQTETIVPTYETEIPLRNVGKALINVGSVGQPRDENPKAAYAIYDSDEKKVWIKRVDYDINKAGAKILKAGLPPILAERLKHGR